jgi:hypothetical protein
MKSVSRSSNAANHPGLVFRTWLLANRFVQIGIERLTHVGDSLALVRFEHSQQLRGDHFHAIKQPGCALVLFGRADCPI